MIMTVEWKNYNTIKKIHNIMIILTVKLNKILKYKIIGR